MVNYRQQSELAGAPLKYKSCREEFLLELLKKAATTLLSRVNERSLTFFVVLAAKGLCHL
jgi:hypothetical protein